jgi:dTDP-4-dehydrorhamnose reductase
MRILIIGSTGQLGQDLMKEFGPAATGLSHEEIEVADGVSVAKAIHGLKPDWVINTAAYHRVDECEDHPDLAEAVNVVGAENVARSAADIGAGVVFFSTDYVFDGKNRGPGQPYEEHDQARPLNVYGSSKLAGERRVMAANPRYLVIRTCGLFGVHTSRKGWTFPELILTKARAGEINRVVTDQVVSPTFTSDLATKVKELIMEETRGLFHLTNSGECSWFEFAKQTLVGQDSDPASPDRQDRNPAPHLEPIQTTQLDRRAPRPAYSPLKSKRLAEMGIEPMRPWQEALNDYLFQKGFLVHSK